MKQIIIAHHVGKGNRCLPKDVEDLDSDQEAEQVHHIAELHRSNSKKLAQSKQDREQADVVNWLPINQRWFEDCDSC